MICKIKYQMTFSQYLKIGKLYRPGGVTDTTCFILHANASRLIYASALWL